MPSRRAAPAVDPHADAADLMQAAGALLRRVRAEAGHEGLSWSQAAAMGRLARTGSMTTAELARAEMVKPQSMGTLLAELEQDGLVQRQPHPTDGRQILFSLTEAGVATRRQRHTAKLEWLAAAIARLDDAEQRALVDAIALVRRLGESSTLGDAA
jgi:DNA-binding MarR family transcriptional regulator